MHEKKKKKNILIKAPSDVENKTPSISMSFTSQPRDGPIPGYNCAALEMIYSKVLETRHEGRERRQDGSIT